MKSFYRFCAVILLTSLAALPLAAQGRRAGIPHAGTSAISNPPALVTVSGSVASVDFQYGTGYPNFELKTSETSSYVIYVGPLWFLDANDFELQAGDLVTASIFRDAQNNNAWVAAILNNTSTGRTLTLRDASGLPLWIGRGSTGHRGFGGSQAVGAGSGQAVHQGQNLRAGQSLIDLTTLETYVGTVTQANIAAGENHPTIEVTLQSGTTGIFCLGPYRFLDQINFSVKTGDSVTIRAADCAQDADEYVVFSITIGSQTWTLRSNDGTPLWYSGRNK